MSVANPLSVQEKTTVKWCEMNSPNKFDEIDNSLLDFR